MAAWLQALNGLTGAPNLIYSAPMVIYSTQSSLMLLFRPRTGSTRRHDFSHPPMLSFRPPRGTFCDRRNSLFDPRLYHFAPLRAGKICSGYFRPPGPGKGGVLRTRGGHFLLFAGTSRRRHRRGRGQRHSPSFEASQLACKVRFRSDDELGCSLSNKPWTRQSAPGLQTSYQIQGRIDWQSLALVATGRGARVRVLGGAGLRKSGLVLA